MRIFIRFLSIAIGYGLASAAAGVVFVLNAHAPEQFQPLEKIDFASLGNAVQALAGPVAIAFAGAMALPAFVAIALSEAKGFRALLGHILFATAAALAIALPPGCCPVSTYRQVCVR